MQVENDKAALIQEPNFAACCSILFNDLDVWGNGVIFNAKEGVPKVMFDNDSPTMNNQK